MSEIFDVACDPSLARVQILPVPYDATTSYRPGAARGPKAILAASGQVDLCDADVGPIYLAGIHLNDPVDGIEARNHSARLAVQSIVHDEENDPALLETVNAASAQNNDAVYSWTNTVLEKGQLPVILGGDHSVPFGAIKALAERYQDAGFGILHVDAHADLRLSYQGFVDSHASIFNNVINKIPGVSQLTQVGIRDFCQEELELIQQSQGRIKTYFDKFLRDARLKGEFLQLAYHIVETLPKNVYVSFDIDGLDPTLCPNTGTPVPGGLNFDEMLALLRALAESGRKIVGLDLCEVAPSAQVDDADLADLWDANVGARVLYKLIGFMLMSQGDANAVPPSLPQVPGVRTNGR